MSFSQIFLNEHILLLLVKTIKKVFFFFRGKKKEKKDTSGSHIKKCQAEIGRKWLQQSRQERILSFNPRL